MSPKSSDPTLRSNQGAAMSAAKAMTLEVDAKLPPSGGVAFACAIDTRRAQSAAGIVIENEFEDEAVFGRVTDAFANQLEQSDDAAFEIVRCARSLIVHDKATRARRHDTPPNKVTIASYSRKCALIDAALEAIQDPWALPLNLVMSRYASRRQTFSNMRSALKWRAVGQLQLQLRAFDEMQRAGIRGEDWQLAVEALSRMSTDLKRILDLDLPELLELSGRKAVGSRSKKFTLRKLKAGWRDVFLAANEPSQTYRHAGVLLRYCGLRPWELGSGVSVELQGDRVTVEIAGAKVREIAGQPWRRFSLYAAMLPAWFISDLKSGKKTYSANADNMRQHLARISAVLYPRKYKEKQRDVILSAYVFRHAFVTDLRSEGWSIEDIAAALGESAAETANWYGWKPHRGSRKSEPSAVVPGSVETCRPVRLPDRKWLEDGPAMRKRSKPSSPGRKM